MNPRCITPIGSVVLSILLIGCASVAAGDSAPPADGGKAPNVHKTYDVRELILSIPNFTDAPDLSRIDDGPVVARDKGLFEGQPPQQQAAPTRQEVVARLIAWIRGTVSPGVWKAGGVISEKDGTLTVDAPATTQQELDSILTDLGRRHRTEITIEFRIISLDAKGMDQADPVLARKLRIATFPLAMPAASTLSDAEFAQILKASGDAPPDAIRRPPGVSLFNGQRAYLLETTQQAFVAGYAAKKDGKGFDPRIKIVEAGLMVDFEAAAPQDLKSAALKTHLQVSELKGMGRKSFAAAPADKKLMTEVPVLDVRELRDTSVIPSGVHILLGEAQAMPITADPVDIAAPAKPSRLKEHVFMVVKVRVFEEK